MKKAIKIAVMTIGVLLFTAGNSWANTVVYDKVELFQTETFFTDMFEITDAGSYLATLTDFEFPTSMIDAGMSVTTATDLLGSLLAPGSFNFDATPGNYFVSFFGFADVSAPQLGQYGIEISRVSAEVPVPAAVWLWSDRPCRSGAPPTSTESIKLINHDNQILRRMTMKMMQQRGTAMKTKLLQLIGAAALLLSGSGVALADTVGFNPETSNVNVGDMFSVDIVGEFTEQALVMGNAPDVKV